MNKEIRHLSLELCRKILKHYSRSYLWSFRFFKKETKDDLCIMYAYLRIADEIVDSNEISDKVNLINNLYKTTFLSLNNECNLNLLIDLAQVVIKKYNISQELFDSFFNSLLMDINEKEFSEERIKEYIKGTGISIGKICLKIASSGNYEVYNRNEETISSISSAFQKINLIRDSDYDRTILGRNYLSFISSYPEFVAFTDGIKKELKKGIKGILRLPKGYRISIVLGILVNLIYYYKLTYKYNLKYKSL